jgi:hypothetical protein
MLAPELEVNREMFRLQPYQYRYKYPAILRTVLAFYVVKPVKLAAIAASYTAY